MGKKDEPRERTAPNEDVPVPEKHLQNVEKAEAQRENISGGETTHAYGGLCNSENHGEPCISATKLHCLRLTCVTRMMNKFVFMKDDLLVRDNKIPRYMLDAHDVDWVLQRASTNFNKNDIDGIKFDLFRDDESYPEEFRPLDQFLRNEYSVTASNLKSEFGNLRSTFTQDFSNFKIQEWGRQMMTLVKVIFRKRMEKKIHTQESSSIFPRRCVSILLVLLLHKI